MRTWDRLRRKVVWRWAAGLLLLAIGSSRLFAQGEAGSPAEVVRNYCSKDSKGVRLDKSTWLRIAPLIQWPSEPDWNTAVLITRFQIVRVSLNGEKATAVVLYDVVGQMDGWEKLDPRRGQETVAFSLDLKHGVWRISCCPIYPHVSVCAYRHMEQERIRHLTAAAQRKLHVGILAVLRKYCPDKGPGGAPSGQGHTRERPTSGKEKNPKS